MGIAQGRHIIVFNGELGQLLDNDCELREKEVKAITEEDEVRVILYDVLASKFCDQAI